MTSALTISKFAENSLLYWARKSRARLWLVAVVAALVALVGAVFGDRFLEGLLRHGDWYTAFACAGIFVLHGVGLRIHSLVRPWIAWPRGMRVFVLAASVLTALGSMIVLNWLGELRRSGEVPLAFLTFSRIVTGLVLATSVLAFCAALITGEVVEPAAPAPKGKPERLPNSNLYLIPVSEQDFERLKRLQRLT